MPYYVRTLIDHHVLLIAVIGSVTLPQIRAGAQQVNALLSAGKAPIHLIIDVTQIGDYPRSPSQIFDASSFLRHENLGYVLPSGVTNPVLSTLLKVIGQMFPFRYRVIPSVSEGLHFLRREDSRLDDAQIAEALRHASERWE